MSEDPVRRIVVIDFEASSLPGPGSYPIEVAAGIPETGEIRSWVIRPEPAWLESWIWDPDSERIHQSPFYARKAGGRLAPSRDDRSA